MMRIRFLIAICVATLGAGLSGAPVYAQATHTWVSGLGDDANPCSRTAPCKTFGGAISRTAAGGMINCLDPGGFGFVVITKPVAIVCDGTLGGDLVRGTDGIGIRAGAADNIYLSGLVISSAGGGGNGINIVSAGSVHVSNSTIVGFQSNGSGILATPTGGASINVFLDNTIVAQNSVGINVNQTAGQVNFAAERSSLSDNAIPVQGVTPGPKPQ